MTHSTFEPATTLHPHTLELALAFVGTPAALRQLAQSDASLAADLAAIAPPPGAVFGCGELMTDDIEDLRR